MDRIESLFIWVLKIANFGILILLIPISLMWFCSYHFYTSVGLDLTYGENPSITATNVRIRWPGDGSLRVGFYQQTSTSDSGKGIDLGAAFFQHPRRDEPGSAWNRLGFWHIDQLSNPYYQEYWLGVPAWIPLIALFSAIIFRRKKQHE